MFRKILVAWLTLFSSAPVFSQSFRIENIDAAPKDAHFRGMSVVDDNVAWISGTKGWVGITNDAGKTWTFSQIKEFEKFDFRTLYAFDKNTAIVANAGAPATILRTTDGGRTWTPVYSNDHPDAFFDGIDFWNKEEGIVYGDPIEKRMLLLRTKDAGKTWQLLPDNSRPVLSDGEASFAASGTGIRCLAPATVAITTGGKVSRLWTSTDKGESWTSINPPVLQGETMTGMYSVALRDARNFVVVGGDYERDAVRTNHIYLTTDSGKTWVRPARPTRGLRECVEYLSENELIATGLPGSDFSIDGGRTWQTLSDERNIYVVRKARSGTLILMCGAAGKIKKVIRQ
jgi:photosystem II stability/assembly factor-like uncharacterized protein